MLKRKTLRSGSAERHKAQRPPWLISNENKNEKKASHYSPTGLLFSGDLSKSLRLIPRPWPFPERATVLCFLQMLGSKTKQNRRLCSPRPWLCTPLPHCHTVARSHKTNLVLKKKSCSTPIIKKSTAAHLCVASQGNNGGTREDVR